MSTKPADMMEKAQADLAAMNESFRHLAEKSMAQGTEAYENFRKMAEEATSSAQKSFDAMREGMTTLSAKAYENVRTNTETSVSFIEKLSHAKSFSEVLELQGEFFRNSFDTLSTQAKEAQALTVKVTEKAAAPAKAQAEKTASDVKAATSKAVKSA